MAQKNIPFRLNVRPKKNRPLESQNTISDQQNSQSKTNLSYWQRRQKTKLYGWNSVTVCWMKSSQITLYKLLEYPHNLRVSLVLSRVWSCAILYIPIGKTVFLSFPSFVCAFLLYLHKMRYNILRIRCIVWEWKSCEHAEVCSRFRYKWYSRNRTLELKFVIF